MPLTSEQLQKLRDWFNSKRVNPACPSCGGNNWSTGDIISANTITDQGTTIGGMTIPMVQVVCSNCGFVKLYAAVPVGLP